jgi:predicted DNA-binding transcriptional regulator AlpA
MAQIALLTSTEMAQRLNISAATLRGWRRKGLGPSFIRLGPRKCIRYRSTDIDRFLQSRLEDYNAQ